MKTAPSRVRPSLGHSRVEMLECGLGRAMKGIPFVFYLSNFWKQGLGS